jgi:putative NADH-flavin reductase
MNLFLLGATGRTGRRVIDQALSRGHAVTAIARDPHALAAQAHLQIKTANVRRADDLASLLLNHETIISCLGQRSGDDATLLQDTAAATLEAMARAKVRRCLFISQGLLFPSTNPVIGLLKFILARHVRDSIAMERLVRATDFEWTIVRPPRLLDGASRGYRIEIEERPKGAWSMQRADLAAYLIDAMESRGNVRTIVGVTSR